MVIRLLLKYLGNNEQLVQKLSESVPIQAAARFVVSIFNKSKAIAEEQGVKEKIDPERIKGFVQKFSQNLKEQIRETKEEFKKK